MRESPLKVTNNTTFKSFYSKLKENNTFTGNEMTKFYTKVSRLTFKPVAKLA